MAQSASWRFFPGFGTPGAGSTVETSGGFFDRLRNGFEDNPNALGALGLGLLAHRQNAVANPLGNVAQNFAYGAQVDSKERLAKQEEAAKQLETNRTIELLTAKGFGSREYIEGLPLAARQAMVDKLFKEPAASEPWTISGGYKLNQQTGEYERLPGADIADQERFGVTPVYGEDPKTGKTVLGQMGDRGTFRPTQLPPNFEPVTRDPFDLARSKAEGQIVGESAATLPSAVAEAEQALYTIEDFEKKPEMIKSMLGTIGALDQYRPGSQAASGKARHAQISGQAFLTSIQKMVGLGQLSNAEGSAATAAATRLSTATTYDEYRSALTDLKKIIKKGVVTGYRKARQEPPPNWLQEDTSSVPDPLGIR